MSVATPGRSSTRNGTAQSLGMVIVSAADLRDIVTEAVAEARARDAEDARVRAALLDRKALAFELGIGATSLDTLRKQPGFPELAVCDSPRFELQAVLEWLRSRQQADQARPSSPKVAENKPDPSSKPERIAMEQSPSDSEGPDSAQLASIVSAAPSTATGSPAGSRLGWIRCPQSLELANLQRKMLRGLGVTPEVMDALARRFVAAHESDPETRPLKTWRADLYASIVASVERPAEQEAAK